MGFMLGKEGEVKLLVSATRSVAWSRRLPCSSPMHSGCLALATHLRGGLGRYGTRSVQASPASEPRLRPGCPCLVADA
eukprot:56497-Chlamydomonas_euryale.AAC.2